LNVDGFEAFETNDWQRKNACPIDDDSDGLINEDPPEDENQDGLIETLWNITDPENPDFIRWEGIDNDGDGRSAEDWVGGVDLNRNYDHYWQYGDANIHSEIYKGPAPFSEPETQAIKNLVEEHNFTYAISFHSGTELILYPWAYTVYFAPHVAEFIEISSDLSSITGGTPYEQSSDLYISYGIWDDWMYGTKNVMALTCEIFGNDSSYVTLPGPYPNTLWMDGGVRYQFNPFPSRIEDVILRWLPVFFNITNRAIVENHTPHDVSIADIDSSKSVVGQGFTVQINITASNEGDFTETFKLTTYANATSIGWQNITLPSGSYTTVSFVWNTSSSTKGSCVLSAVADTVPYETDIYDNNLTNCIILVTKVGDFGGGVPPQFFACDGKADGKDLNLFLQCFKGVAPQNGMYLGDLGGGLPPQFFKCDGKVDGKDLSLFLQCYKGVNP
jgi:hypothetical protein